MSVVVRYGKPGYVGRFAGDGPRGAAVVVRTPRGVEPGVVLATADGPTDGEVLRAAVESLPDAEPLLQTATVAAAGLPLTVVDAEVLLDRSGGVVHALVWGEFDGDALFADLSLLVGYPVRLFDLTNAGGPTDPPEPSCGSCGTGGGCGSGCGSCSRGQAKSADELSEYFLALRKQMEADPCSR